MSSELGSAGMTEDSLTRCRYLAQKDFAEHILPLPPPSSKGAEPDEAAWTDRLLCVMRFLDVKAVNVLLNFSNIKARCAGAFYMPHFFR